MEDILDHVAVVVCSDFLWQNVQVHHWELEVLELFSLKHFLVYVMSLYHFIPKFPVGVGLDLNLASTRLGVTRASLEVVIPACDLDLELQILHVCLAFDVALVLVEHLQVKFLW